MPAYFSDYFDIDKAVLEKYGAFNVSLVTDLPLFIDPFLLFNSKKPEYQELHRRIINYLTFLRDKADAGDVPLSLLKAWYCFPEVKQTWLGFTQGGNQGSGLGRDFAIALHENLHRLFSGFGKEQITRSSHLEKLCLIREGVGRDNISDFTTNLIKGFLCRYTATFARQHLGTTQRRQVSIPRVQFNFETETWESATFELPWADDDFVLLTPKDILTKDDTWINKTDLVDHLSDLPTAIPNEQLRAQVANYLHKILDRRDGKEPTRKDVAVAARSTIREFPDLIDVYIRYKEDRGDEAVNVSAGKVRFSHSLYVEQYQALSQTLYAHTRFYEIGGNTYEEAHQRIAFLKDVVENKGGHRLFYVKGHPIQREEDVHILYRLTWFGTPSDVTREANDGRGPADFKVSRGARDKTIVEFKLAKNKALERNLKRQAEIYMKASDASRAIKVIFFFSDEELNRVNVILKRAKLLGRRDVVLVDAREDNKPSGSRA